MPPLPSPSLLRLAINELFSLELTLVAHLEHMTRSAKKLHNFLSQFFFDNFKRVLVCRYLN